MDPTLNTPPHIGSYKIIKELGRGGMGAVYLGYDEKLQRYVAIKIILEKTNNIAFKRFIREAQTISKLDHPHITKVYELHFAKEKPYMVMEYVEGEIFEDYIKKNNLSLKDCIRLLVNVIDAVHFAHKSGVIHRDIKSSNIIVDRNGKALLMDFGLAKLVELEDKSLTKTGNFIGTPKYMSPEQATEIKSLNHLSDIYSLGVVIYEAITGVLPVEGDEIMEILYNLIHTPITPPRKVNPKIPLRLEKICLKALEHKKEDRYQSAKLLSADLRRFLTGKQIKIKSKMPIKKWITLGSIAIVMLAFFIFLVFPQETNEKIKVNTFTEVIGSGDVFTEVMGWINNGFWEKAEQELEQIKEYPEKKNYYRTIINGYGENNAFTKYYDLLSEQEQTLSRIKAAKLYFEAKQSQKKLQIADALKKFKELEKLELEQKILSSYIQAQLYYHIAMCSNDNQTKIDYLEESLVFSKGNESTYHHLAKIYFERGLNNNNYDKAEEYIQKCIELESDRSDYYVLLGNIYLKKKELDNARVAFENAKSLEEANLDAIKGTTEIVLYDVALFERFYFSFLGNLEAWEYKTKDILSLYAEDVMENNSKYYDAKINAIKNQGKKIVPETFKDWNHSDLTIAETSVKSLITKRHHEDFLKITDALNITTQDFYKKTIEQRDIENEKANYYLMAKLFLYPKSNIVNQINPKEISEVLDNKHEMPIYRYFAANTLIQILEFEKIREIAKNQEISPLERLLCASALENNCIFLELDNLKIPEKMDSFTKVLLAKNKRLIPLGDDEIEKMLQEQNKLVVLATIIYRAKEEFKNSGEFDIEDEFRSDEEIKKKEDLKSKTLELLEKYKTDHELKEIAENCYWKILPTDRKDIWEQKKDNFAKSSKSLQITILERATREKTVFNEEVVLQILKQKDISPYTKIKAIDFLTPKNFLKIEDIKNLDNDIVHAYGFYKFFLISVLSGSLFEIDYLIKIEEKRFLRCYGYGVYSKCGEEVLHFIEKENDPNMKSIILRTSTIQPFPVFFKTKRFPNIDRQKQIEKYLHSKNLSLQKEAYKTYMSFHDLASLVEELRKLTSTSDKAIKEGIIEALFIKLDQVAKEANPLNIMESFQLIAENEEFSNINNIKQVIENEEKVRLYEIVSKLILQVGEKAQAHLILALIAKKNKSYDQAIEEMRSAIKLEQNNIFYLLELVTIFAESGKEIPEDILKNIFALSHKKKLHPSIFFPLTEAPKNNAWIKKILQQNCLAMISEKDKPSDFYKFRNKIWSGVWKQSWRNLDTYLGSDEKNFAKEVLNNIK